MLCAPIALHAPGRACACLGDSVQPATPGPTALRSINTPYLDNEQGVSRAIGGVWRCFCKHRSVTISTGCLQGTSSVCVSFRDADAPRPMLRILPS